ncbi:hypothetical protein [Bradyrhizobium sp. USDA 4350]
MKKFRVVTGGGAHGWVTDVVVEADYVKLEGGALVFKREVRHSYPEFVRAFAPGRWLEFTAV